MPEPIQSLLRQIETKYLCQILYACESGSRAWGFASPDSDYDIRFIYAHPISWYLQLEPKRDTIEIMAPGNLDLAGWELSKTLRLFGSCNLPLNEWMDSPTIYRAQSEFHASLCSLIPHYFNPKKSLHHYLSMAERMADHEIQNGKVRIKKLFYILRPLLAGLWITTHHKMPPTRFDRLLEQSLPTSVLKTVQDLLAQKSNAIENETIAIPTILLDWITDTRQILSRNAQNLPKPNGPDWKPLNTMMKEWVPRE